MFERERERCMLRARRGGANEGIEKEESDYLNERRRAPCKNENKKIDVSIVIGCLPPFFLRKKEGGKGHTEQGKEMMKALVQGWGIEVPTSLRFCT